MTMVVLLENIIGGNMKRAILLCLLLAACGQKKTYNTTSIQCTANPGAPIIVPAERAVSEITALDAVESVGNIQLAELPGGDVVITYTIEQCNGNGNPSDDDGSGNQDNDSSMSVEG